MDKSNPPKWLTPRVLAAITLIIVLVPAYVIERIWGLGFQFIAVVALWTASLAGSKFNLKFPKDE